MDEEVLVEEDSSKSDSFMNHLSSTLAVKRDYEMRQYDYQWLDIIEDVLPYLDNILRNPKRFIINEEEIVKVELARKVTVESVIHLTQHTNLIQDIDKNGDVKPSKILNINKEESLDTYENRFIYTLIQNLRTFFEQRVETTGDNSYYVDKKNLKYEATSRVGTEDIHVSLFIDAVDKNIMQMDNEKSKLTYAQRLKNVKVQIDGFMGSELMQTLAKLHVSPVRSPIRKTNVILKNPNFQKAEALWNYIQTYVNQDKNENNKEDYYDEGALKNEYDQAILLTYLANRSITEKGLSEKQMLQERTYQLIENLLDADDLLTEDKLKEVFNQQIANVKQENQRKKKVILKVFQERLERDMKKIIDATQLLEEGGSL